MNEDRRSVKPLIEIAIFCVPIIIALLTAYTYAKRVPMIEEKVQAHDVRLAVQESQLISIKEDTTEIKRLLRRKP